MAAGERNDRLITAVLGWTAGYADTAGFLGLRGLFTAHVTGNLVVAGAQLAGASEENVWVRLLVVPVFILAIALSTILVRRQQWRLSRLLWLEAATLLLFLIVGIALIPVGDRSTSALSIFLVGATGVFAMGIQNALMRETLGSLAPTTVMTGNLTQLTIDLTQVMFLRHLARPREEKSAVKARIKKFGISLLGFLLGAVMGAVFMKWVGFWSMALPAIAIAFLAIHARQAETKS